ncbi:MAG: SRPBCC family protein [Paracoccaceae bacterium]
MRLAAKYDVEAPVEFVFAQLADFNAWERSAMRRGADIARTDALTKDGPGMSWLTTFGFRNKDRSVTIKLDELDPTSTLAVTAAARIADGILRIELLDLAARRTRVEVKLDIKPKSLAARIYVQSLRLTRSRVERNFAQRVAQLAVEIEDRFRGPAKR